MGHPPKRAGDDHHDCNSQASWDHFSWLPPFKAWHLSNLHAGIQQLVHHALQFRIFQLLSQHLNLAGAEKKICTHHTSWHHQINTIIIIISISTPNFNPATYLQSCFLPISPCLFQSVILVLGHGVGVEGGVARAIGVILGPALRLACPSCGGHGGGTQGHHGAAAKAAAGGRCRRHLWHHAAVPRWWCGGHWEPGRPRCQTRRRWPTRTWTSEALPKVVWNLWVFYFLGAESRNAVCHWVPKPAQLFELPHCHMHRQRPESAACPLAASEVLKAYDDHRHVVTSKSSSRPCQNISRGKEPPTLVHFREISRLYIIRWYTRYRYI